MDVLSVCPRLIQFSPHYYEGFVTAKNQDFHIKITLPPGERRTLHGTTIECEWRLKHLLRHNLQLLKQRLQNSSSLAGFLVEFVSVLESQIDKKSLSIPQGDAAKHYAALLQEIETLGWDKLNYIDSEFKQIHLKATDEGGRGHVIQINLPDRYPELPPLCKTDLPRPFEPIWSGTHSSLMKLYQQFAEQLQEYQVLWDQLGSLDRNTWILEPEKPVYSCMYRRIALESNASLQIEVNPQHPRLMPECRFLGADHVISPLKEKLNQQLHLWDPECNLLENLQTVLGVEFPSPSTTKKEDFSADCGICYAYRLDSHIPDQVCDDSRCAQPFHQNCLYEWLRALPDSRQSFNTVFGECPYCSKPITVKMPHS